MAPPRTTEDGPPDPMEPQQDDGFTPYDIGSPKTYEQFSSAGEALLEIPDLFPFNVIRILGVCIGKVTRRGEVVRDRDGKEALCIIFMNKNGFVQKRTSGGKFMDTLAFRGVSIKKSTDMAMTLFRKCRAWKGLLSSGIISMGGSLLVHQEIQIMTRLDEIARSAGFGGPLPPGPLIQVTHEALISAKQVLSRLKMKATQGDLRTARLTIPLLARGAAFILANKRNFNIEDARLPRYYDAILIRFCFVFGKMYDSKIIIQGYTISPRTIARAWFDQDGEHSKLPRIIRDVDETRASVTDLDLELLPGADLLTSFNATEVSIPLKSVSMTTRVHEGVDTANPGEYFGVPRLAAREHRAQLTTLFGGNYNPEVEDFKIPLFNEPFEVFTATTHNYRVASYVNNMTLSLRGYHKNAVVLIAMRKVIKMANEMNGNSHPDTAGRIMHVLRTLEDYRFNWSLGPVDCPDHPESLWVFRTEQELANRPRNPYAPEHQYDR